VIFVTVGMQTPFDRLVRAMDEWAAARGRDDVFAQIGATEWRPQHIQYTQFVSPAEFAEHARRARLIVAHAGIGTIFTAMEAGRSILVMPRRAALGETRNDHQLATVRRLAFCGITVAGDESELTTCLDRMEQLSPAGRILPHASAELLDALRACIERGTSIPART